MSEAVNIHEPVADICERLGLVSSYVKRLEIHPTAIEVELYKGQDGTCQGSKYVDSDTGEPAVESLSFEVAT